MTFLPRSRAIWVAVAATALSVGLTGCVINTTGDPSSSSSSNSSDPTDFISDNPRGGASRDGDAAGDGAAAAGTSSSTGGNEGADPSAPPSADDPARAIAEADIIQIDGDKLYALSYYSGLSIIDISRPDRMSLLGRHRSTGVPFEMYLRDGIVYAMFSSWGTYVYDEATDTYDYVQTSRIEALDVGDPGAIVSLGSFDLPGSISDSRIVGDVLYAVTFEDGACWGCSGAPNTTITSLSVADPAEIEVVDQLTYGEENANIYGWRRSISVTEDRMYVAGIEWDGTDEGHSTIQIIDISDPGGALVEGASVEAVGQIQSRWQMDEREGILRVISQPGLWRTDALPGVQTFAVTSSNEITPLGYTELRLPRPETLRSVRFDGDRAYAITAEQTDPLFTIDLSDPANPVQLGELEMPGWVYHMEPRGDRLLALGFDNAAEGGSLHVSLFDVSDLTRPTMLERIAFGGNWSSVAEDQDRIHKAFTVLDSLGTILVPYSGWSYDGDGLGCGSYESGIQLIDFTRDTLTKRGVAASRGQARRAFVHDERLFAVSDEEVRTFDIGDRDAPTMTDDLALATIVNRTVAVGDVVVRMSADWWTSSAKLEVVPIDQPGVAEPIGELDLHQALAQSATEKACYGSSIANARLFTHDQYVYLLWPSDDWTSTRLAVIDVTDPREPSVAGRLELPFDAYWLYYGSYGSIVSTGESVVQAGSTLIVREAPEQYYYDEGPGRGEEPAKPSASLEIIDLSNPRKPAHSASVKLPEAAGYTGLQLDGTTVLTSHWVPLADDPSRVRFYFDRIDVSNPSEPVVHAPVNVPGSLLAFDGASSRLLTVDYTSVEIEVTGYEDCYREFAYTGEFEPRNAETWEGPGTCRGMRQTLKLLDIGDAGAKLRDERRLADGMAVSSALASSGRAFLTMYGSRWATADGFYREELEILVAGGLDEGNIEVAIQEISEHGSTWPQAVVGKRLVLLSYNPYAISVLDATDLDNLTYETKGELSSYASSVTIAGDDALCSLGHFGIEVVDIGD